MSLSGRRAENHTLFSSPIVFIMGSNIAAFRIEVKIEIKALIDIVVGHCGNFLSWCAVKTAMMIARCYGGVDLLKS